MPPSHAQVDQPAGDEQLIGVFAKPRLSHTPIAPFAICVEDLFPA